MGSSAVPRRLSTGGVYKLCRHPQALGNMLFLIGGWAECGLHPKCGLHASAAAPHFG